MPFFRFDPPPLKKMMLSTAANSYDYTIPMMMMIVRAVSRFPTKWIDFCLDKVAGMDCAKGRNIALDVLLQPNMMRNHLVLGLQEIRGENITFLTNDCFLHAF